MLSPDTILQSRYRIVRLLGKGGMGEVYLARDSILGRTLALKILPGELAADQHRMQRFIQEAKAASALNHPNILTIYEIGQVDSLHFISTEYIDGETLRQHVKSAGMELKKALDIAIQVSSALSAAHEAGIVHRDIKPENIMLRHDGYVKILDFGLAKLIETTTFDAEASTIFETEPGIVMGTPYYMSPEQARGLKVDARTDIWSVGVVLYELLTGHVPFSGSTSSDVIASILKTEPLPLANYSSEIPVDSQIIIEKALCKECDERYQTVKDFAVDLKRLQRQKTESPPNSSSGEKAANTDKSLPGLGFSISNIINKGQRNLSCSITLALAFAVLIFGAGISSYLMIGNKSATQDRGREGPNNTGPKSVRSDMVLIPGGTFLMGRNDGLPVEVPAHPVTVNSFYIDRTEVTNGEYAEFVNETKHITPSHWSGGKVVAGQEMWPVNNVSLDDARAFAAWRSKRDGVTYRLPTEEEWEYAARNGSEDDLYPWGGGKLDLTLPPDEVAVTKDSGAKSPLPVGSKPSGATFRGVFDMIGNVWEWTSSQAALYPGSKLQIPNRDKDSYIFRGGGYDSSLKGKDGVTATYRDWVAASRKDPTLGFRLVRAGDAP